MLTLDFTSSRNLSHALVGSRSRAGLVAAVITRKRRTLSYFHRCEKLVESKFSIPLIVFQNFGVFPHRSFPLAPVCPVRCFELLGPRTAALRQRGIVAD